MSLLDRCTSEAEEGSAPGALPGALPGPAATPSGSRTAESAAQLRQRSAKCTICSQRGPSSLRGELVGRSSLRGSFRLPPASPRWWPWRGRWARQHAALAEALESRAAHVTIIALVLLDLCIVVTELILSSSYCDEESRPHAVHTAEEALRWSSVAILCLFMAELLAKLGVFGLPYFATSWFHGLDAVIVTTSLVLEVALHGLAQEVVALLVFFRLWRVLRIMHAVAEALELQHEEHLGEHHAALEAVNKELAVERRHVRHLEAELAVLRGRGQGADGAGCLPGIRENKPPVEASLPGSAIAGLTPPASISKA